MGLGSSDVQRVASIRVGIHIAHILERSALCVTEASLIDTGKTRGTPTDIGHVDEYGAWHGPKGVEAIMSTHYRAHHMQMLPYNVSYPDVAAHLVKLFSSEMFSGRRVHTLVNISDVGLPVWKDTKQRITAQCQDIQLFPVTFTLGETYNRSTGKLGKAYMVSRMQSLLQEGCVRGPFTDEMKETCDALMSYNIKASENHDDYRISTNEGLAVSLALSCLIDPFGERIRYSDRVF